ncbi:alpha/beta fold hydrolase [Streptomyces sp. NPDC059740]|uniref:alpha/beta fold hydrolase n=1 Tax=Streptomyces sp. NPDC059740 TaxID=3346926 RepID=UPI00364E84D9
MVLVHGNPESSALWDPLVAALDREDVVRLSPPGFGAPVPEGFAATVDAYRDWLAEEVSALGGPVHLVGHDWGGGHVVNLAMSRPDLVRSWTTDILGVYDPEYVWHDRALTWQSPGGPEAVAAMTDAPPERRAQWLVRQGAPREVAEAMAAAQTPEMGRCILALYRSAAQPAMAERGEALPSAAVRPGLSIVATEDPYVGTPAQRRRAAGRAGAREAVLDGLGHWWMLQDPRRGAEVLGRFLREVEESAAGAVGPR